MKKLILLLSLLVSSCGIGIHVDPILVKHTVTIDPLQLEAFYKAYCESKYTNQADIDQCVTDSLAQFWQAVNSSSTTPGGSQ